MKTVMAVEARLAMLFVALFTIQLLAVPQLISAGDDAKPASLFKPMLVLVGDSITEFGFYDEGWGLQLARSYSRKADVLNRGFGGYTSRMGVYVLDEFLNSFGAGRIKLVTIGFGANDASLPNGPSSFLSVPLDEYKANLVAMVKKLRNKGITNIVIITPPPVNDSVRAKKGLKADKTQASARRYANAAMNVAQSLNLPFVDLQSNIMRIKDWQTTAMDADGVHLSYTGQKAVYDSLMYIINSRLKSISPYALPIHMPTYIAVNKDDPGSTFNSMYGYTVETDVQLPAPSPPPVTLSPPPPPPKSNKADQPSEAPEPAPAPKDSSESKSASSSSGDNSPPPSNSASSSSSGSSSSNGGGGGDGSNSSSQKGGASANQKGTKPGTQRGSAGSSQGATKAAVTGTGGAKRPSASKDAVMATKGASPPPAGGNSKVATQRRPMNKESSKSGEGRSR